MGDFRFILVFETGVAVVGAPAGERIVHLGQQLQHEVLWGHADAQQEAVVAVIGRDKVFGFELQGEGELCGFMATARGVNVF